MSHTYYLGRETGILNNLKTCFDDDFDKAFTFVVTPLFHPKFRRDVNNLSQIRNGSLTRPDTIFDMKVWSNHIVGKLSTWINLDCQDSILQKSSEYCFREEINYACHLNVPAIVLPPLMKTNQQIKEGFQNYASLTYEMLLSNEQMEFWLPIYLRNDEFFDTMNQNDCSLNNNNCNENQTTLDYWNSFYLLCNSHHNLKLALYLTSKVPSKEIQQLLVNNNISAIFIPTNLFIKDDNGFPHLSSSFASFIQLAVYHNIRIILTGKSHHTKGYNVYVHELNSIVLQTPYKDSKFCNYNDHIQIPLQPLMDNLTSSTYETFELDSPKYQLYEQAITKYFQTHSPIYLSSIPTRDPSTFYVMVVGAGRGPLVRATIRAAEQTKKKIHIYVIEKNVNAIITLKNMKQSLCWGDNIEIFSTDMRQYSCPTKSDLIISELLGSFGDNELSPECLQGTRASAHDQTVYIPQQYTSYIEPIMAPIVYNNVRRLTPFMKEDVLQCTYVVKLFSSYSLSDPQPLFSFYHPDLTVNDDYERHKTLTFKSKSSGTIYGFAGYFECQLYDDVMMSILPSTHTPNMYSWFPLYIPLTMPIIVAKNDIIKTTFWRKSQQGKVWYEWCLQQPVTSIIHNCKGKHQWIGL